eukprot:gene17488-23793_t
MEHLVTSAASDSANARGNQEIRDLPVLPSDDIRHLKEEAAEPMSAPCTQEETSSLLLPKYDVGPTSPRWLVGLWDLAMVVLMLPPFLLLKLWRKDDVEQLMDSVVVLRSSSGQFLQGTSRSGGPRLSAVFRHVAGEFSLPMDDPMEQKWNHKLADVLEECLKQ